MDSGEYDGELDKENDDESLVTLEGEDGKPYLCQVLQLIEFEGRTYGLLLNLGAADEPVGDTDDSELVIMRVVGGSPNPSFEEIDNDEEFDRVAAAVHDMAPQQVRPDA